MKKHLIGLALLILLLTLTACGGGDAGEEAEPREIIGGNQAMFENVVFLAEFSAMPHVTERIHGTILHENRIYFAYVTETHIVIESISPDGTTLSRTEMPHTGTFVDIAGMRITEDGNFALIFTDIQWAERGGGDTTVYYAEFSAQGAELTRREIPGLAPAGAGWSRPAQALFLDEGAAIAVDARIGEDFVRYVYLLDDTLAPQSYLVAHDSFVQHPLAQTQDGRLFFADTENCPERAFRYVLREIDREAGLWGESFQKGAFEMTLALHSARADDPFDLFIISERGITGYHLESGEEIPFLNWMESRVPFSWSFHVNFFEDGQISVLIGNLIDEEEGEWETEHVLLTPTERGALGDFEIITVGGWATSLDDVLQEQAAAFNQRSHTHQIQITDVMDPAASIEEWDTAIARFHMDVMTGQGPDIIWLHPTHADDLLPPESWLDLYDFIDRDPELSRTDFFPNILSLLETGDGRLPVLGYSFSISTLIGMADIVGDRESWTFGEMRALVEQAVEANMNHIIKDSMGREMNAEEFLWRALWLSGDYFLDFEENRANLDNESFIELLELAARLPQEDFDWGFYSFRDHVMRMRAREELLKEAWIYSVYVYRMYRAVFEEDMVFVGWPSHDGGNHTVNFVSGFAINASAANPDAAWDFLRQFLMPGLDTRPGMFGGSPGFTLRIDELEAAIAEAMIPEFDTDRDGNEVEVPRVRYAFNANIDIPLYAMTQAEAEEFRSIIEGANITGNNLGIVMDILMEEWTPFAHGDRTAAEAARIMQNRVQTFLWERS